MRTESLWTIHDEASSELEMQELLYSMVRMLKPALVVETGCHRGFATLELARAVASNGFGRLVSCDTDSTMVLIAKSRVGVMLPADIRQCRGADLGELRQADFIFCDSDYKCREEEIALVKPGAVVLVHDTRISYDGNVPPLEGLVRRMGGLVFDSHRGWGLIRKGM